MGCRRRFYFTDSRKAEIWDRRQPGESMRSIGRGFDRNSSSIFPLLPRTCAIRQLARARSRPALAHCDREEISGGLGAQLSFRAIARRLHRAPWTISRAEYRAARSDQAARDRALRPRLCKLACRRSLCRTRSGKLARKWSPQQITGCLKRKHPDDEDARLSHETIYRGLFIRTRADPGRSEEGIAGPSARNTRDPPLPIRDVRPPGGGIRLPALATVTSQRRSSVSPVTCSSPRSPTRTPTAS